MNVSIRIDYISSSKISQSGSFPIYRGQKTERVALLWWKELNKETSYRAVLEKVIADGNDITKLVKNLEQEELKKIEDNFDLPF
jgi:hypothetical protein